MNKIHLDSARLLRLRAYTHGLIFREYDMKSLPNFTDSNGNGSDSNGNSNSNNGDGNRRSKGSRRWRAIVNHLMRAGVTASEIKGLCQNGVNRNFLDEMIKEGYGETLTSKGKIVFAFRVRADQGPELAGFAMFGLYETPTKFPSERAPSDASAVTVYMQEDQKDLMKAIRTKTCGTVDIVCAKRDDVKHKGSMLFSYCMCRLMAMYSKRITHVVTHLTNYERNSLRFVTDKIGFSPFKMSRDHRLRQGSDKWLVLAGNWKRDVHTYMKNTMKSYEKICRVGTEDVRGFSYCV